MKKMNIKLNDLRVASFVTSLEKIDHLASGTDTAQGQAGVTGGTADCSHCCPTWTN